MVDRVLRGPLFFFFFSKCKNDIFHLSFFSFFFFFRAKKYYHNEDRCEKNSAVEFLPISLTAFLIQFPFSMEFNPSQSSYLRI